MQTLVVNSGSSSMKFELYALDPECALLEGEVERIGSGDSSLWKSRRTTLPPGGAPNPFAPLCASDTPMLEMLAAVELLRRADPDLKIRVANVVDLMTPQPAEEHPHGLTSQAFNEIFTPTSPSSSSTAGIPG